MKKELFHIEHYSHKEDLREYSLSVKESENIYVFSGSLRSLSGVSEMLKNHPFAPNIYWPRFGAEFIGNGSVSDNFIKKKPFYKFYSRKRAEQEIYESLEKLEISIDVSLPFLELTKEEKIVLSLFNCIFLNKKIILLDQSTVKLEKENEKLVSAMIKKLNAHNISFIILASEWDKILEVADVVQYVRKGTVVREFKDIQEANEICKAEDVLAKEDVSKIGNKDEDILFTNLSITDNLIINLKKNCGRRLFFFINQRIIKKITSDFYLLNKIDRKKQYIEELSLRERQALVCFINKLRG